MDYVKKYGELIKDKAGVKPETCALHDSSGTACGECKNKTASE